MVAEEGVSVNIVAGTGVKQPKQSKESPKPDMPLPRVTWEEEPHVLSRNTLGKESRKLRVP